jgi:hypothetical protein
VSNGTSRFIHAWWPDNAVLDGMEKFSGAATRREAPDQANAKAWTVVDMKRDWKLFFEVNVLLNSRRSNTI